MYITKQALAAENIARERNGNRFLETDSPFFHSAITVVGLQDWGLCRSSAQGVFYRIKMKIPAPRRAAIWQELNLFFYRQTRMLTSPYRGPDTCETVHCVNKMTTPVHHSLILQSHFSLRRDQRGNVLTCGPRTSGGGT